MNQNLKNTNTQSKKSSNGSQTDVQIKIKTMNGTVYSINTKNSAFVSSIQPQIQQKTGVPVDSQRLLHKAILLQSNCRLSDYSIIDGSIIQLVANMLPQQISSPSISTHRHSQVARTHALTQQSLRTKKHRYLQQRINGFSIKNLQSIETLKQNKKVINKLLSIAEKNKQTIRQPFPLEQRNLALGDWVDVRDVSGLWVQGQVVGKKHNFVEIHCNGYPDRWNQWIEQSSQRIMPLRTQTVQSQECPYMSPFPINRPQIKSVKFSQQKNQLQKILLQIPQTLNVISQLFEQLQLDSKNKPLNKYSFNQLQVEQQGSQQGQEDDKAQSFKNNRSHNSPPQSIHQQEYQYEDYEGQIQMINQQSNQIKTKASINIKKQVADSGSIKGKHNLNMSIKLNRNNNRTRKFVRSNRYIDKQQVKTKNVYVGVGYSKTKSQHQHTLNHNHHREQTPTKDMGIMIDQVESDINLKTNLNKVSSMNNNVVIIRKQDQRSQHGQKQNFLKKLEEVDIQEQVYTPKYEAPNTQFSQTIIISSATKQHNLQADNISNKCQQNMSNKGDHDDGESSKSFGSKRSDRFLDASSMKSLNIETLNHQNQKIKQQKSIQNKHSKNIFLFDNSEAQSVRSVQNKDSQTRSNYYYNQQGILEEQDSQINQQINQQYYMHKKKQMTKKLRATQLAPLCDRLGRFLIDLAPHLATIGYQEYNGNALFNQNLSTFTNEGSLQSRFRNFNLGSYQNQNQGEQQQQQKSSLQSSKYCSFQIPIMLTPCQIMKINKLLSEEARESRDRQNQ